MNVDPRRHLEAAYFERRTDLLRFFAARLGSPAAAEDLVQDIYLRIARLELREPIESPAAFLYRLGSNLMLDQLRGQKRSAARDGAWRATERTHVDGEDLDDSPAADVAVAARQRLAAVLEVVEGLPPATREVFRLHKLDGLSHAEVASHLGISRSGVEKHMMAALRRLAASLP